MKNKNLSNYRADIDGLRAFAVLSVVLYHAFPDFLKGGFIGVDIFFVISGFLITGHIFESLDKGDFSFTGFFVRRIRRIFPALILVMVASLLFGWFVLLSDEYAQLGKHVASGSAFIQNFTLSFESGYFDNQSESKPMLHLWSLAVEEQFYIIWPLIIWLAWKLRVNVIFVTIFVAFISFYMNMRFVDTNPVETFYWPVGRFWELLSGSVLAWLFLYKREQLTGISLHVNSLFVGNTSTKKNPTRVWVTANAVSITGIVLLIVGVISMDRSMPYPSFWALIPVVGAVLIIFTDSNAWIKRVLLANPIATWFGLISYPLYLWHWPILSFLQIIEEHTPHRDARILAVVLSIFLAWLTYKFIEKPIRFGVLKNRIGAFSLTFLMVFVGVVGYCISISDFRSYDHVFFKRTSLENKFGSSLKWYEGKDNWLFLGNEYDNTVAKLKLSVVPSADEINETVKPFEELAVVGSEYNTKIALIIGPNKSSVHGEYLPDELLPSEKRYISFFKSRFQEVENLVVYDPTDDLINKKSSEGLLYWRTNTHWNPKGCYIAYKGFTDLLGIPSPDVDFEPGPLHKGDLIYISKLYNFPLSLGDGWNIKWNRDISLSSTSITDQPETSFGVSEVVTNHSPLSEKTVWVIGDSFTAGLRPYLNATFKEVRYIGHWAYNLDTLSSVLQRAENKPDLVLVVRVERSF
ncbi:acyltransferase family protein [Marinomonas fungiae]|uniref:Peptidoglycan/LPS O-acetylase OafA/YrhL, contains acyltransferase and SGNH-hydrolase domains n=1 Tax=Marinomonas fungiae TaxID=1137284 RepID=A0A0K6IJA2_9GAMM|nr:acyltransferase family protein [Marinomonas fungiae]CUB03422.1 Peptidoglycan/LPS O-acetylase OafA/YrhL, contains acyltransferase and SGNH-hydrolase domains [Marinomonas fungiae]